MVIMMAPHVRKVFVRRIVYGGSPAPTYVCDYVESRLFGASASVAGQEERRYWGISVKIGPRITLGW